MQTRVTARRDRGNFLVGLLILIVGIIIVVKLWTTCAKLFPPPSTNNPCGGTNGGTTNFNPGEAQLYWLNEPGPGITLLPAPNTQFVLWGMVPTNNNWWYYTNSGVGYVQVLNPNDNGTLNYSQFTNVMRQAYDLDVDTNMLYGQVATFNPNTGQWTGGLDSAGGYAGYITVNWLCAGDSWVTMYLQRSTNGVDWINVTTNYIKCGEFQLYLDLGYDKMALYRTQMAVPFVNPAATSVDVH